MKKEEIARKMKMPKENDYYSKCKICGKGHSEKEHKRMIDGKSEKKEKGKKSLNSVGKNEEEHNDLGHNEQDRA